jgi:hypothetical protein
MRWRYTDECCPRVVISISSSLSVGRDEGPCVDRCKYINDRIELARAGGNVTALSVASDRKLVLITPVDFARRPSRHWHSLRPQDNYFG